MGLKETECATGNSSKCRSGCDLAGIMKALERCCESVRLSHLGSSLVGVDVFLPDWMGSHFMPFLILPEASHFLSDEVPGFVRGGRAEKVISR